MQIDSFHHKTYEEAHEARARLRAQYPGFLARIELSPYGEGYRVRLIPVSLALKRGFLVAPSFLRDRNIDKVA